MSALRKVATDDLVTWGDALGVPLRRAAAARIIRRLGEEGARIQVAEYAMVARAAQECGRPMTTPQVAQLWTRYRCGVTAAARVRERARRSRLVGHRGLCRARRRLEDRTARENAYARCMCERCVVALSTELRRYMGALAARTRPRDQMGLEEAIGEAQAMLMDALVSWPGEGNFTAWFAGVVRMRFLTIRGKAARDAHLLRLDGPAGESRELHEVAVAA